AEQSAWMTQYDPNRVQREIDTCQPPEDRSVGCSRRLDCTEPVSAAGRKRTLVQATTNVRLTVPRSGPREERRQRESRSRLAGLIRGEALLRFRTANLRAAACPPGS